MEQFNICVSQAGEGLYLHPVAYYPTTSTRHNRVLYLPPLDYPIYASSFWRSGFGDEEYVKFPFGKLLLHQTFGRLAVALWRSRLNVRWNTLLYELELTVPVVGISLFSTPIPLPRQLTIHDPEEWSDQSYLIPSQKYLNHRLDEYIDQPSDQDEATRTLIREYLTWAFDWRHQGATIGFLCSVNPQESSEPA